MSTRFSLALLLAVSCIVGGPVIAADIERGQALVDGQCTACHGNEVYARAERRIQSLEGLEKLIPRCARAAGADWGQQELADVVAYLNQRYYRFQ